MNKLALFGLATACKIIFFQFAVMLVISLIILLVLPFSSAISFFVGGLIAIMSNTILAMFLFSYSGATQLRQIMSRFYRGVSVKMVLTSVLLATALKSQQFEVGFLFAGFTIALVAHLLSPNSFN